MDVYIDGRTMDVYMDGWADGCICGWMNGLIDGCIYGWMKRVGFITMQATTGKGAAATTSEEDGGGGRRQKTKKKKKIPSPSPPLPPSPSHKIPAILDREIHRQRGDGWVPSSTPHPTPLDHLLCWLAGTGRIGQGKEKERLQNSCVTLFQGGISGQVLQPQPNGQ